ncbi:MAG: arginase family protein [Bacteroidota bacterium]
MKHLNLFFPEWQGYAENNIVQKGATAAKDHFSNLKFESIEIPESEELLQKNNIIGYHANLRNLSASRAILEKQKPDSTFLIGGTCASEIGPVSYLNNRYNGDLAVLWFDAHGDLNTPESSPSKHFHGMPLRTLLGESDEKVVDQLFSKLKPNQVFVLGGRDIDTPEKELIENSDVTLYTPSEVENITDLVNEIKARGFQNLYIHIDLDVLEPKEFPHLLLPIADGVSIDQLKKALRSLVDRFNLVGSSIVEYVPQGGGDVDTLEQLVNILGINEKSVD